jgi:trk system potassium uptake protein TrkH
MAALGGVLKLFSFGLLVPFAASFVWDQDVATARVPLLPIEAAATTVVFGLTFLFAILLALTLQFYGVRELDELREREGFLIVGFVWLLLPLIGGIPFLLTGAIAYPLDAFFEAMSGVTTTGATVMAFPLEQYPESVMLWRAMLQWIGGIGIIVLSVSVLSRVTQGGHRILAMEAPGDTIERLKPRITETAKTLSRLYFGFSVIIFVVYLILMRYGPRPLEWGQAGYDALLHTFTTLSTGGFSNRTDSLAFYGSDPLLWAATIFMLVAGGAFPLYWAAFHGKVRRLFTNGEFRFYLLIFAGAAVLIAGALWGATGAAGQSATHAAFQAASFLTTTGYTSANHNAFPDAARLVLFLLMFTGGMAGSTAGGIKVFRIHLLFKLSRREMQKLLHPHAVATVKTEGRIMPEAAIRRIFVFFFIYLTLFIAGAIVYMQVGLNLVGGLSASASAIGNVGPGFDTVASTFADMPAIGKVVAILQMWLGRLEIFTVLLLFIPATYRR